MLLPSPPSHDQPVTATLFTRESQRAAMRAPVAAMVLLLLLAGCLGSSTDGPDLSPQTATEETDGPEDARPEDQASGNASYLQNSDYRQAHIHNYWQGADRKVLMDEVLSTDTEGNLATTVFSPLTEGQARTSVGTLPFTLPNGSIVPEGAGQLIVQVDATSSLDNGQLLLEHKAADRATYQETDPQGAQAEWVLELSPEMADLPHAKSTRWGFRLEASGPGAVLDGDVAITITAVKVFDLTAWPSHADFWSNGEIDELDLGTVSGSYDYLSQHLVPTPDQPFVEIVPPDGNLVPPETTALVVNLTYDRDETDPKNMVNGPVILIVKDGATSRGYKVMHGNAIADRPGFISYALPVTGATQDSPYANQSGWRFELHAPMGYHDEDRTIDIGGGDFGKGTFEANMVAYRVLPAWLADIMPDDIGR